MNRSVITPFANIQSIKSTKVKTGCATCKKRRVKCDEKRPFCQKCVSTGRKCDGYESPFRFFTNQAIPNAPTAVMQPNSSLSLTRPSSLYEVTPLDIEHLNHCFSIKTMLDVKMGCGDEARQLLQASLTDPTIRHAVLSLLALREDLDASRNGLTLITQGAASYDYGLQQYNRALRGLVSNMSPVSGSKQRPRSVLLCCQIFISIEQLFGNYDAMAQHIIRGLGIMREYQARPGFIVPHTLVSAHPDPLPLLDVFIIKLFSAPCKFADPTAKSNTAIKKLTSPRPILPEQQQPAKSRSHRTIVPDMRAGLTRIAESVLEFLDKVSHVQSVAAALRVQLEKAILLHLLKSWVASLELVQAEMGSEGLEPVSVSFMRMLHQILQIVLLGTLDVSSESYAQLQREIDQLQAVANIIGEGVRHYRMYTVTS